MKNESKIRRLLGYDYHLCVYYKYITPYDTIVQWKLYKKYDDIDIYFSNDNKPIMDNEHNTEDELLEFAKTHHKIDEYKAANITRLILLIILLILSIINMFIHNVSLRHIIISSEIILLIESIVSFNVHNHNWRVKVKNVIEKNAEKFE